MKIISNVPVIIASENDVREDCFSEASGAERRRNRDARAKARTKKRAKGEDFGSRVGRGFKKIAESGAIDALLKGKPSQEISDGYNPNAYAPPVIDEPKKMKIGYKILIGVGILGVVGTAIWYFGFRTPKGTTKSKK